VTVQQYGCHTSLVKVKVPLSLSTPRRNTRGAEVQLHSFLTLALEGAQSRSERLSKMENLLLLPGFERRTVQPETSRYTDYTIPARHFTGNVVYMARLSVRMPQQIGQYFILPVQPSFDSQQRHVSSHKRCFCLIHYSSL
jgi:hypothetical protein